MTAVVLLWAPDVGGQTTTEGVWSIGAGLSSSRDELNVGLLYQGAGLHGQYLHRRSRAGREISWSSAMAVTFQRSRGTTAIGLAEHTRQVVAGLVAEAAAQGSS